MASSTASSRCQRARLSWPRQRAARQQHLRARELAPEQRVQQAEEDSAGPGLDAAGPRAQPYHAGAGAPASSRPSCGELPLQARRSSWPSIDRNVAPSSRSWPRPRRNARSSSTAPQAGTVTALQVAAGSSAATADAAAQHRAARLQARGASCSARAGRSASCGPASAVLLRYDAFPLPEVRLTTRARSPASRAPPSARPSCRTQRRRGWRASTGAQRAGLPDHGQRSTRRRATAYGEAGAAAAGHAARGRRADRDAAASDRVGARSALHADRRSAAR